MLIYNVGFINADGKHDCTQLDIEAPSTSSTTDHIKTDTV